MTINPTTDRYILEGRIVTMRAPGEVIDNGRVLLRGRVIEHVLRAGQDIPAEFASATRIATGSTIYPGLIELHNHLAYNAMPLWDVPTKYSNNGQWRGISDYKRRISRPSQVLGRTDGVKQALIRYAEGRALLGGVTSTQGITLVNANGIERHFRGLVRNVEQAIDAELTSARPNISDPKPGQAAAYLAKLNSRRGTYLQHLSEGTDATARSWFTNLRDTDGTWAITQRLCGIHATALLPEQLRILADHGGSMVWSPTSNYLLYAATADVVAAKAAKIRMALGSDWAPSGTKNLLGELKVAWLASQEHAAGNAPLFSPEELVAMVTINPATILGWQGKLGSIEAGKWADLVLVAGKTGGAYEHLVRARETSLTLVVVDGVPRVGRATLMNRFDPGARDSVKVGASTRVLNVADPVGDPIVGELKLSDAIVTLRQAMRNLPQHAAALDAAIASGTAFGATADAGVDGASGVGGAGWYVEPDFEQDDIAIAAAHGIDLAAEALADWVEPMELDPITVADDPAHVRSLISNRNLPEFVKRGLPKLYGLSLPIPSPVGSLTGLPGRPTDPVRSTTGVLRDFARVSGSLSLDDRLRIVDQAIVILEENYVHLPLKRAMHAVDPVQRLRLLRRRLEDWPADEPPGPDVDFHAEVTAIFTSLRDLHTGYRLPAPFNTRVAWLPFLVEECLDHGRRAFVVSKIVGRVGPATFAVGAEVTHWNGMTIEQAIARNADRQAGSNADARWARGLNSLTLRPLASSLPPDEEWVTVRYLPAPGRRADRPAAPVELTQAWLVFEPGNQGRPSPTDLVKEATAYGVDEPTDDVWYVRKVLFASSVAQAERRESNQVLRAAVQVGAGTIGTHLPGVFKASEVRHSQALDGDPSYGYIRIYTFSVSSAEVFIEEFVDLARQLPVDGLVIDVRGNGGGLIYAAEALLQVLSPREIEPARAEFIATSLNRRLCRRHAESGQLPGLVLKDWVPSLDQAVTTGAAYSHRFPITSRDLANQYGQRYFGPVVLITDPLCYSATDMFAAGFADHGIGPVIGVGGLTGAGGANVWTHALLSQLMAEGAGSPEPSPYRPLPGGAGLRVAIRRTTRVADNPGDVLEDLGVRPDIRYAMTRDDVLGRNGNLIDRAIEELRTSKPHPLDLTTRARDGQPPVIVVRATNATRVDVRIDAPAGVNAGRHWFASQDIRDEGEEVILDPVTILRPPIAGDAEVEASAHEGSVLVARRRERVNFG